MQTIGSMILRMKERTSLRPAVKLKEKGKWREVSWEEYYREVVSVASAFLDLGLKAQDKVAIMSNTRWEWAVCDLAVLGLKAVTVPIYPNNSLEETEYIINHSEARYLVCENRFTLSVWRKIKEKCPNIEAVICFEIDRPEDKSVIKWPRFREDGAGNLKKNQKVFEISCGEIEMSDIASYVYTSGTTGRPKGVIISHEQVSSEITEVLTYIGLNSEDTTLTFLPFAHVLGRVEHWGHVFIGFTMAYAETIEKIRYNLPEVQPTVLVAVPRIFEKVYSSILAQVETQETKKKIFDWALDIGKQISRKKITRERVSLSLLVQFELARRLVLNKVTEAFGGKLRFAVSGGAALNQDMAQFFHAAGILILEGYGLTETTAAVSANTPFHYRFGFVGRPIGDVKVKLAADGELLIKSKKVMKGYLKDPEATADVLKDGWLHTGDIAEILPGGDIRITDRKKDLIKTAGGKYVAPQKLENGLKTNPLIANVLIHGDQKKYIVVLITLDKVYLEQLAQEKQWTYNKWTDLVEFSEVFEAVKDIVNQLNSQLASFESIKKFKILPQEFTVEGGELTPSMKVKRRLLDARFKDIIEALYD